MARITSPALLAQHTTPRTGLCPGRAEAIRMSRLRLHPSVPLLYDAALLWQRLPLCQLLIMRTFHRYDEPLLTGYPRTSPVASAMSRHLSSPRHSVRWAETDSAHLVSGLQVSRSCGHTRGPLPRASPACSDRSPLSCSRRLSGSSSSIPSCARASSLSFCSPSPFWPQAMPSPPLSAACARSCLPGRPRASSSTSAAPSTPACRPSRWRTSRTAATATSSPVPSTTWKRSRMY